jgi:hypothetical protein
MTNEATPASSIPTLYEGGRVIRLITDDELIFNLGAEQGVTEDMLFDVLDSTTEDVYDPLTMENLGSIERIKSQIQVINIGQRIALARVHPPRGRAGISYSIESLMGPKPPSPTLTGDAWPDGVKVNDHVRYTGKKLGQTRKQQ